VVKPRTVIEELVDERHRIAALGSSGEAEIELATWYAKFGAWAEENIGDYLQHRIDCNAYTLNSKPCTCGVRELLRSLKTKGKWARGEEYESN